MELAIPANELPYYSRAIAQNVSIAAFLVGAPLERDVMATLRLRILASPARAQMFLFAVDVFLEASECFDRQRRGAPA